MLANKNDYARTGKSHFGQGISFLTDEADFKSHFKKFGKIASCKLMTDEATARCLGFGFIEFANSSAVQSVLNSAPHYIRRKNLSVTQYTPSPPGSYFSKLQVFVYGIDSNATEFHVRQYFNDHIGEVGKVELVPDKNDPTKNHKGFGFVYFLDESSSQRAIKQRFHVINGKTCEAKIGG